MLSKPTARTNLDVHSKAESNAAGQPGDIKYTARSSAPTGWLKANGAAVSRTAYAELFAAIGTVYGEGDGFNTFNLPDLRGEFVRGWDDGRGVDAGRIMGSWQKGSVALLDPTSSSNGAGSLINTDDNAALMTQRSGYDGVDASLYSEVHRANDVASSNGPLTSGGWTIGATRPRNVACSPASNTEEPPDDRIPVQPRRLLDRHHRG